MANNTNSNTPEPAAQEPVIEIKDLSKIYVMGENEVHALRGVSLTIHQGEYVAIIGASGSGKSTLMNMIGLLDRPTSGSYRISGVEASQLSKDRMADLRNREIGFVFQRFNLLARTPARRQVELPLFYAGVPARKSAAMANEALTLVGLGDRLDHRPDELSGGQQQRVAIARALVNNPNLLLADEPTGALDSKTGKEILALFDELHEKGITLVIVTHDMGVAGRAERIVTLRDGVIVDDYLTKDRELGGHHEADNLISSSLNGNHNNHLVSGDGAGGSHTNGKEPVSSQASDRGWRMRAIKYLGVAWESIQAHRMRAILTMLGIIIGVAAVLVTVGIGSGAAASITERIESSGTNLLTVSGGSRGSSSSTLTMADAEVLSSSNDFPTITGLAPQYSSQTTVANGSTSGTYQVVGTTATYATIRDLELASGSFLPSGDTASNSYLAVIGDTVATDLFGGLSPVGESIRIGDALFQVIGVLEASGSSGFGSIDSQVFVPINVALGRLFNADRYRGSYNISSISIQVDQEEDLDATETQVEQVLRLRHGLGVDDDNDFQISNQADLLDMASSVSGTLSTLLGGIGAVSLIVGGIGIMNIMLVSVTERTREIGLRKAVGAHDHDILLQFLVEALVLCTLGGLIGIAISYGIQGLIGLVPGLSFNIVIQPWAVGLALAVSTASGFIFGLYPAMRATQLDPIEALRYE